MNAAMVNPASQQVSFVYVPITFYESGTNLKEFLLSIIQCCSFTPGENTEYVREYIRILNAGINFSVFDLEEYIKRLQLENRANNQTKKCSRCGTLVQPNVNFCSSCGMKISGITVDSTYGTYDPAKVVLRPKQQSESVQQPMRMQPAQEAIISNVNGANGNCYSETVSHSISGIPQPEPIMQNPKNASITRCRTGERIAIMSPQLRIGKDPHNCEYCIADNSAISRCHVVIKRVNGKWYINDLNSTNKTYIGDRAIPPYTDIELVDGLSSDRFSDNVYRN